MFFKKILMPCGLCMAIPAVKPVNSQQDSMSPQSGIKKLIRPSELPIYSFEDNYTKEIPCKDYPPSALEQNISKIRKSVQAIMSEYQYYNDVISDTIYTGIEHSRSLLDYLREESNIMPRVGAIGIGGLIGLVLGLRGRTFKRLTYSSMGALGMAALCYPKKTEEVFSHVKSYTYISWNFINGVKPSSEQLQMIVNPKMAKIIENTSLSGNKEENRLTAKSDTKQN